MRKLLKLIRQALCEHEYHVLYPDVKFRYDRGQPVRYWLCQCRKCGKRTRIESRKAVM